MPAHLTFPNVKMLGMELLSDARTTLVTANARGPSAKRLPLPSGRGNTMGHRNVCPDPT